MRGGSFHNSTICHCQIVRLLIVRITPITHRFWKKSKLKKLCLWPWLLWLRSRLRPTHPDRTDLDPDSRTRIRTAATTGAHQDWWGQGFEKFEASISLNWNRAWKTKKKFHLKFIQSNKTLFPCQIYSIGNFMKKQYPGSHFNTQPYYLPESKLNTFTLPRNQGQI